MKNQLQQSISSFDNEAALRGAIHDLLLHMPTTKSVQVTHGSQELGKDIVFRSVGGFGEEVLCACVVKNHKISGAVDDQKGAMTVLHQVRQAFKKPLVNTAGALEKVSRVYIMSPHDISQIAMSSIQGELDERSGQVVFLCGHDLLTSFEKNYPEYLLLKSGLLTSYVSSLRQVFEQDGHLQHLAYKHGMLASAKQRTSRAYVRPEFKVEIRELVCSKCEFDFTERLTKEINFNELEDILEKINRLVELLVQYKAWNIGSQSDAAKAGKSGKELGELHSNN